MSVRLNYTGMNVCMMKVASYLGPAQLYVTCGAWERGYDESV